MNASHTDLQRNTTLKQYKNSFQKNFLLQILKNSLQLVYILKFLGLIII